MSDAPLNTPKQGHKRAHDLTKKASTHLISIEAGICIGYVSALGFRKVASDWINPPDLKLPESFELKIVDGMPTATVDGEMLNGYELVAWLVVGSKSKGIHLIKLGALVLLGTRDLSEFKELTGYNPDDPQNSVLRVLKLVELTLKHTAGFFKIREKKKSNAIAAKDARQVEDGRKEVEAAEGTKGHREGALPLKIAATENDASGVPDAPYGEDGHEEVRRRDGQEPEDLPGDGEVLDGKPEEDPLGDGEVGDGQQEEEHHIDEGDDYVHEKEKAPLTDGRRDDASVWSKKKSSESLARSAAKAMLTAFNAEVPDLKSCLGAGRAQALEQTCWEIQVGRLLLLKKDEVKVTSVFTAWKTKTFPDCDKYVLSRCYRYGIYERRMKSKRGALLKPVDVTNCTKKAMLLIGGYRGKNADELVEEIIARLDGGEVVNESVASDFVHMYKAKLGKPKPNEDEPPATPQTIQELHELPERWLSPTGRKHMEEFQVLLESLEPLVESPSKEAAVVLPLVRMFTVL